MLGPEELMLLIDARDFLDTTGKSFDYLREEDETGEVVFDVGTRCVDCYDFENFRRVELEEIIGTGMIETGPALLDSVMLSFVDNVPSELSLTIDIGSGEMVKIVDDNNDEPMFVTGQQEYIDMFAQGLLALKKHLG